MFLAIFCPPPAGAGRTGSGINIIEFVILFRPSRYPLGGVPTRVLIILNYVT